MNGYGSRSSSQCIRSAGLDGDFDLARVFLHQECQVENVSVRERVTSILDLLGEDFGRRFDERIHAFDVYRFRGGSDDCGRHEKVDTAAVGYYFYAVCALRVLIGQRCSRIA